MAPGLAGLEQLGSRSRFRGSIWSTETPQGHRCEVIGEFTDVDLDGLVTDHFTHRLSGPANVTLQVARFQQGRLVEAAGTLQAGPGRIGRSLLDAAATRLKLAPGTLPEPGDPIPYDRLACEFFVDSDGLWLRGQGSGDSSGAILTGRYGPLLGNPASQPQPVVALLGMLVPGSEVQVPATRQTAWLMRHLPD